MQRTFATLRHHHPLRFTSQSLSRSSHLPSIIRPCTCTVSRTFTQWTAPRNSTPSSDTSSAPAPNTSTPPPPENEENLSMEEKLARHRARVAAGRAKRHAELEAQAKAEAAGLPWPPEGTDTTSTTTAEETQTSSTSTSTPTEENKTAEEPTPAPQKESKPFDLRSFIRSEIRHIRAHLKANQERKKRQEEYDAQPKPPPSTDNMEELKDGEEPVSDGKFYAPMIPERHQTEWDKRISGFVNRFRNMAAKPVAAAQQTYQTSDNKVISKTRELNQILNEKMDELQETIETSQHPTIWKIRDFHDNYMYGGDDAESRAKNMIEGGSEGFNLPDFLQTMQDVVVPTVTRWIIAQDMESLRTVIEKETPASAFLTSQFKASQQIKADNLKAGKLEMTDKLAGLSGVNLAKSTIVDDEPWLVLTFMGQIGHHYPGAEQASLFTGIYYIWAVCPDHRPENPYGWRIAEISWQKVDLLQGEPKEQQQPQQQQQEQQQQQQQKQQ